MDYVDMLLNRLDGEMESKVPAMHWCVLVTGNRQEAKSDGIGK